LALSDIDGSLKNLNEKLDWIINRLNYLENVLTESQQYPEVVTFLQNLKMGTAMYGEPLKTLNRIVSVRKLIESISEKDEINKIILNYIALKGPKNVSEFTREVGRQRGKASRTTIRNRIKQLVKSNALVKEENRYRLP
jgi:DNA-binding HxlR family transcriptional regulator